MVEKTIEELLELIGSNKINSEELVKESVAKAKTLQEQYNSFVTIIDEPSSNIENLNDTLFKGIPCAIKDNNSTEGVLTTGSSNILKDYVPFFDATVVS